VFEELTRLNSRQRKRIYKLLVDRDGEKCNKCGKKPPNEIKKLVIDRIDNQGDYSDLNRLQLLCYSCNYKKNPRIKERKPLDDVSVSECVNVDPNEVKGMNLREKEELEPKSEIEINREKEPEVREYVKKRIRKESEAPWKDLIDSAAEVVDISPITTERHIRKLVSSEGEYEKVKSGRIFLVRKKRKRRSGRN